MVDKKVSPFAVICPACNAQPTEPCTQPDDRGRHSVKWFHFAREAEAEKESER